MGYYSEDTLFHLNQILEANNSSFIIEDGDLEIMKRAAPLNTMFGMNYYRSEFIREYKGENRQEFNSTGIKGQSSFKLNALGEFVKKLVFRQQIGIGIFILKGYLICCFVSKKNILNIRSFI